MTEKQVKQTTKVVDYSEWLRGLAKDFIAGETVHPCPEALNRVADKLDILRGRSVADDVLKLHYRRKIKSLESALDSYMDAYQNMRQYAIDSGLDVTCYYEPDPANPDEWGDAVVQGQE